MANSQELIQKLIDARSVAYGKAFEERSAEAIASWQSEDLEFNDIGNKRPVHRYHRDMLTSLKKAMDEYHMSKSKTQAFFTNACAAMSDLGIIEQKTRGTAEMCSWEMLLHVTNNVDDPTLGLRKGQQTYLRGVAVQEWRWEGPTEKWEGDLSDSPRGIRGWKIVSETDYMCVLKDGMKGQVEKLA